MNKTLVGIGIVGAVGIIAYKKRRKLGILGRAMRRSFKLGLKKAKENHEVKDPVKEHTMFSLHLTGVTFEGRQDLIRYLNKDTVLKLKENPVPVDGSAVSVVDDHERIVGWIPRTLAPFIGMRMWKKRIMIKSWRKVGGEKGYKYGIVVTFDVIIKTIDGKEV